MWGHWLSQERSLLSVISLSSLLGDQSQENSLRGTGAPTGDRARQNSLANRKAKRWGGLRPGGWEVKGRRSAPAACPPGILGQGYANRFQQSCLAMGKVHFS